MSKVRDIARRACRHLKGAASSVLNAIAGPTRGVHSAAADDDAQSRTSVAHSMRSSHTNCSTRSNSTRSAHSTGLAPRPSTPLSLQTAPAGARGYSMAEVLATVAIIVILCAIVVVNVVSFQANLRQKELDAKAEIIYTAAQEQMTRIMASGRESAFAAPSKDNLPDGVTYIEPVDGSICSYVTKYGVSYIPAGSAIPGDSSKDNPIEKWQTCFITSSQLGIDGITNGSTASAANLLFGNGGLDDELLNGNWVIEYDCKSLTVHGVYYSESYDCTSATDGYTSSTYSPLYINNLRNHSMRLNSENLLNGKGKHVGYHGGGGASANVSYDLEPNIQISNTEKLTATITCSRPLINEDLAFLVTLTDDYGNTNQAYYCMNADKEGVKALVTGTNIPVNVSYLTVDQAAANATFGHDGLVYTLVLTLDSLEKGNDEDPDALRFTNLYGSNSIYKQNAMNRAAGNNTPLVEGSNIHIKAQAFCLKNPLVEAGYAGYDTDLVTNSLYAYNNGEFPTSDGWACVAYGRHLQNLDEGSGVNAEYWHQEGMENQPPYITQAVQLADVVFSSSISSDTENKGWTSTYGSARTDGASYFNGTTSDGKPCFEPIKNTHLTSYQGSVNQTSTRFVITHLNIREEGNAGLFASTAGNVALTNLVLTGPTVEGSVGTSSVGGLVGINSGNLTINNCQLFLSPSTDIVPKEDPDPWLKGSIVGGLVGTNIGNGTIEISNSSASTVLFGSGMAGGLVGSNGNNAAASLKITASYADCYLKSAATGGLLAGGNATVTYSYAAGFLAGTSTEATAAGIINGGGSVANSYAACGSYGKVEIATFYRISKEANITASSVRYLNSTPKAKVTVNQGGIEYFADGSSATDLRDVLNGGTASSTFTVDQQSKTNPYKLMGQGLDSYTWPTIKDVYHYGDWPSDFQPGTLVYFEKYRIGAKKDNTVCYGFEGAGVSSTLINEAKLEDGKSYQVLVDGAWTTIKGSGVEDVIVVGDGYGVVYESTATNIGTIDVSILMPKQGETRENWDVIATQEIDTTLASTLFYTVKSSDKAYKIYPLRENSTATQDNPDTEETISISNINRVNANSYFLGANIGGDSYFFNPHFAKTVHRAGAKEQPETPHTKNYIYLRTGRQLYNLSLYYYREGGEHYRSLTEGHTFYQERNIAFTDYEWKNFANQKKNITSQEPIGTGTDAKGKSFTANYDGGCHMITDVSFVTQSSYYVGMFGYVGKNATIKNVVLCTDYVPASPGASDSGSAELDLKQNYYVQRKGAVMANEVVHMGVLVGYNEGKLENCATAGYFLAGEYGTIHAYANSTSYIGGLVGTNTSSIVRCAADSPKLRLSLYDSETYAAGFVGNNTITGTINNSYALGAIDVADAKNAKASIAGFAGINEGLIEESYCATAIASSGSGTKSYGFAPAGGRASNCRYLNGGTYSYVSRMYPYNFNTNKNYGSGDPIRYEELKALAASAPVDGAHSFVHSQTQTGQGDDRYPYRGVIKDADDAFVHYGNWQDDVVLGTLGVFYWEHEEYGSNNGYHLTYLGTKEEKVKGVWSPIVQGGTSLCASHDDGGVITEYGYGVYVQSGQSPYTSITWNGIGCSNGDAATLEELGLNPSRYNAEASLALAEQMENTDTTDREYSFYAFTTRVPSSSSSTSDCLYLNGGTGEGANQNGTLTLSFANSTSTESPSVTYSYTVSPFFANALSINGSGIKIDGKDATLPESVTIDTSDVNVMDCKLAPGTAAKDAQGKITSINQYEVRSLQQLQYINWNAAEENTKELVGGDASSYQAFPYLQYATDPNGSSQSREDAEAKRPFMYWLQTHDVKGVDAWNSAGEEHFSPIAGAATTCSSNNSVYDAKLYAWFGSSYDGQSYTIKNVSISSESFFVGLFGVTAGANINNVILYGDSEDAVIERKTPFYEDGRNVGAYAIGGLVGVAFNYTGETASTNTISNCAISGYKIVDSSQNRQALGEACIGGIIGVANVNLQRCSAVTDIVVQPDNHGKCAQFGNFIRVGGLVGGLLDTVENCYSGGTVTVGQAVLDETYDFSGRKVSTTTSAQAFNKKSTHIFIAGIAGSAFSSIFTNFGGKLDGEMEIYNSYTYMSFPTVEGTIRSVSMIGTIADRHHHGNAPYFSNCYYLESSSNLSFNYPSYYFEDTGATLEGVLSTGNNMQNMLVGNMDYIGSYLGIGDNAKGSVGVVSGSSVVKQTYANMKDTAPGTSFVDKLNANTADWAPVTSVDAANVSINGKFSYPSNPALEGMDYPFPTVVTQRDLTFSSGSDVHVHYGDWPLNGSYWASGRASMDIFSDMDVDGTSGYGQGWAYGEFTLFVDTTVHPTDPQAGEFEFSVEKYAQVVDVQYDHTEGNYKAYKVTIKAFKEGSTRVYFDKDNQPGAYFTLQITANWVLSAQAASDTTVYDSASNTLKIRNDKFNSGLITLLAHDTSGDKDFSTSSSTVWVDPASYDEKLLLCSYPNQGENKLKIVRHGNGQTVIAVTAQYKYNINDGGQTFTRQLFINVEMPSMAGLSNNLTAKTPSINQSLINFNEVQLGEDEPAQNNISYGTVKPNPQYIDNNFFLYTEAGDLFLENPANVKSATVKVVGASGDGVAVVPNVYETDKNFYVELNSSVTTDGKFTYLGGTLFYTETKPSDDALLELTVTLQGNYELTTYIPASWVDQKVIRIVTLQRGDDASTTCDFTVEGNNVTALEHYDASVFDKAGWELDGWYTTMDDSGVKVLDAKGKVIPDTSVAGYIEGGAFKLTDDVTLYAKWKKTKRIWALANSIQPEKRYVIASSNTAGSAYVAYQDGFEYDAYTLHGTEANGVGLDRSVATVKDGVVTIAGASYSTRIEDNFDDDHIWVAASYNGQYSLTNARTGYFLAENNTQFADYSDDWAVLAVASEDDLRDCSDKRWRVMMSLVNSHLNCQQAGTVNFLPDASISVLACNRGTYNYAYLYEEVTSTEYTSTYESVVNLTLMSEGTAFGPKDMSSNAKIKNAVNELGFSGLPTSVGTWELGWYDDSDYSKATKVLEADGSVVSGSITGKTAYEVDNGALVIKEDLTLYAIWRRAVDVYIKTEPVSLDSSKEYLISVNRSFLTKDTSDKLTVTNIDYPDEKYYLDKTLLSDVVVSPSNSLLWRASNTSDFKLINAGNTKKALIASEINDLSADSELLMKNADEPLWNYSSGMLYAMVKKKNAAWWEQEQQRFIALKDRNWVGSSTSTTLTFYEKQNVYQVSTTEPGS